MTSFTKRKDDYRRAIEEQDVRVRFLIADITALLDRVPASAIPDISSYLESALKSARVAMHAKIRDSQTIKAVK